MNTNNFFQFAIDSAMTGVSQGDGAPFGACIVQDNKVISIEHDTVLKDRDATCHAEINAIREASRQLSSHRLDGCAIYCTSEPCPMCLSAMYWSGISECYFVADKYLGEEFGFEDAFIYKEFEKSFLERRLSLYHNKDCFDKVLTLFATWKEKGLPVC